MKNVIIAIGLTGALATGLTAAPASAQQYYGRQGYSQSSQDARRAYDNGSQQDSRSYDYRQQSAYQGNEQQRRAQYGRHYQSRGYQHYDNAVRYQGNAYPRGYSRQQYSYQGQRCRSGRSSNDLGSVVVALLGQGVARRGCR